MKYLQKMLGVSPPLEGLEATLADVAAGKVSPEDAAKQIRHSASQTRIPLWFPAAFKRLGGLFALIGCAFGAYSASFSVGTERAAGTVIAMDRGAPIVEYLVGGQPFKHKSSLSSEPPSYSVGEKVNVLYRLSDPTWVQIDTFTDRWLFPVVFGIGGALAFATGVRMPKMLEPFEKLKTANSSGSGNDDERKEESHS